MARRARSAIDNRSSRLRLKPRKKAYHFTNVGPGIAVAYRRTVNGSGRWVIRCADGKGGNWEKVLAGVCADDFEDADGEHVLDFHQACEKARALARGSDGADSSIRPLTVGEAVDAYERELIANNGDPQNATRIRRYLTPTLASKPVGLCVPRDFRAFRDAMIEKKLKPSSVIRNAKALAAALSSSASLDPRIVNRSAWTEGLGGLSDHHVARNVSLPDESINTLVGASYEIDPALGLLVETASQTGARPIQLARLRIADLHDDGPEPKLMMPSSFKGKKTRSVQRRPVPITPQLARKLRKAADKRAASASLLLQSNGSPWLIVAEGGRPGKVNHRALRLPFAEAAARCGLPKSTTFYSLRHSSIIRQLLAGVPTRVVASGHDTSVPVLERSYSDYITDFSDALIRRGLLDTSQPPGKTAKVIPIQR